MAWATAQARNATHSEKKLTDDALFSFVKRFDIPVPEEAAKNGAFYRPPQDSTGDLYLQERRKELGGYLPDAQPARARLQSARARHFNEWSGRIEGPRRLDHDGLRQLLKHLLKDPADRQADRAHRPR